MSTRMTAIERKDDLLDAALIEFAEHGYEGTSTEDIARRAGISQPYLFRLFGTKKELFKATSARCLRETLEMFQRAAEGKRGEQAVHAMAEAYLELLQDRTRLGSQLQAYAACDDPEICEVVRAGYGDLVAYVERVSGLDSRGVMEFFAIGMLLTVFSAMDLDRRPEPWSERLLGSIKDTS